MATHKRVDGDYVISTINPTDYVVVNTNTLEVNGNLDVIGNLTYINVTELNIKDPFIVLNSSNTNVYPSNSGILTHKTASDFAGLRYNGTTNQWELSLSTSDTGVTGSWDWIVTSNSMPSGVAGPNGAIQYNSGNAFAGSSALVFDDVANVLSVTGTVTAANISSLGLISAVSTITGGNLVTSGIVSAAGNVEAANIVTSGEVSATGNVNGGNLLTTGIVSATGDVSGGNVTTVGYVSATGNVIGDWLFGSTASLSGNVVGGNLTTNGEVSAAGNITGAILLGNTVSATGNVTGGNITTAGNVDGGSASFTGNITAANFIGNVSGNISTAGSNTWVQYNDDGIMGASGNFTFDEATNVLTVVGTITGATVSSTGNVIGGNFTSAGEVTATGNVTGGNVTTVGYVSASGNVTGNWLIGNIVSTTGNITGGNLLTSGLVLADTANLGNLNIANTTISSIGNITLTPAGNDLVTINSTSGFVVPVGNTAQQPAPATIGTLRYNTEAQRLEIYDGTQWDSVVSDVTNQILYGDGANTIFALNRTSTTAATLVALNGLIQLPGNAYTVSGNVLTFTQAPTVSDVIDVRFL